MDEVVNNELVDHLDELSTEADHNIMLMDGVIDTVNGSEGMDLTAAQHYLAGVMFANGVAPLNRAGNEGVLTKIKTFIQTAIVVVKEFIRKIWSFFFGDTFTRNQKRLKKLFNDQISELKGIDRHRELSDDMKNQMRLNIEAQQKKDKEYSEKIESVFQDAEKTGDANAEMWATFSRTDAQLLKALRSGVVKKSYDTAGDAIEFLREALDINEHMGSSLSEGQKILRIGEQAVKIGEGALKGEEDKDKLEKGENAMRLAKLSIRAIKIMMEAMKGQVSLLERMSTHLKPQHFK